MTIKLEEAKKEVHAIIEKLGDRIPPQAAPLIENAIAKMKVDNLLPKDALGFPQEALEMIYQQGYYLFQNGKYQEALILFNFLRDLDLTDSRYSFAIAACYHQTKDYLDAAANYAILQYMDPLDPLPPFHSYDCYRKADYPEAALLEIQRALALAERNLNKYWQLKEQIQLEFENFKAFFTEYVKEKKL